MPSARPSARPGASSRWPRSASTQTQSCGCRRLQWRTFDDDLKRLATRMGELMKDANGVGLAATQVGVLRRVFVFARDEDEVAVLVNPEIVRRGDEADVDDEGCLSIQGVTMPVERPTRCGSKGATRAGEEVAYDLEGTPARIVQHELDHLDGTMILDRTTPEARREALAALRPRLVIR